MPRASHADLAVPGAVFAVQAVPAARRPGLTLKDGRFRIAVTAPAEEGRATAAVTEALASALGVAKTRLTLLRGATTRDKLFRLD